MLTEADLNFEDLSVREIKVPIKDRNYLLLEASEDAARQYQNLLSKNTSIADGKVSGIQGPLADAQSLLISLCIFHASEPGVDKPGQKVDIQTIRKWPHRVTKKLFVWIDENSELTEDDTEESLTKAIAKLQKKLAELREDSLGNEQSSTTGGSS